MKTTSKKSAVFSFIGIVSDVLLIVAFFVKWFRYTATYQPQTPGGAVSSVDYYFSMAENLKAEDSFFMFWLVLSLIAASIVCFCADIIKKRKPNYKNNKPRCVCCCGGGIFRCVRNRRRRRARVLNGF